MTYSTTLKMKLGIMLFLILGLLCVHEGTATQDKEIEMLESHMTNLTLDQQQEIVPVKEPELTPEQLYNLGYNHERGRNGVVDMAEAVRLYGLAADRGYLNAQRHLGYLYEHGQGVTKSTRKATQLYLQVAESDSSLIQGDIVRMFKDNTAVTQNPREKRKLLDIVYSYLTNSHITYDPEDRLLLLKRLYQEKHPPALERFANMYEESKVVSKSNEEAREYHQYLTDLANMYEKGQNGLSFNRIRADELYALAVKEHVKSQRGDSLKAFNNILRGQPSVNDTSPHYFKNLANNDRNDDVSSVTFSEWFDNDSDGVSSDEGISSENSDDNPNQ